MIALALSASLIAAAADYTELCDVWYDARVSQRVDEHGVSLAYRLNDTCERARDRLVKAMAVHGVDDRDLVMGLASEAVIKREHDRVTLIAVRKAARQALAEEHAMHEEMTRELHNV